MTLLQRCAHEGPCALQLVFKMAEFRARNVVFRLNCAATKLKTVQLFHLLANAAPRAKFRLVENSFKRCVRKRGVRTVSNQCRIFRLPKDLFQREKNYNGFFKTELCTKSTGCPKKNYTLFDFM